MFWRTILILLIAKVAAAQVPAATADTSVHSIIVKFRTIESMNDPSISAAIRSISPYQAKSIFPKLHSPKNSIQSIDTFGFDRIVQIPLRAGITAISAVRQLSSLHGIEYAEPNYNVHIQAGEHIPNDPLFSSQWWLKAINAPQAWAITEGDSSIHIGFVDEGANFEHEDLKFQFAVNPEEDRNHNGLFDPWPSDSLGIDARGDTVYGDLDGIDHNGNGYVNDVIGYNFTTDSPIPFDAGGHGTAMAGIMAAEQDNHLGVSGIAPKCKLVALKAFDETGTGEDVNIARAIVYAADNGVKVLNCSFGDIISSLLQRDAIRYAISKGVIIFGSSGNSGGMGPNFPSDFDEVVSVGGTTENGLYPFTTHGAEMDCVAPGNDVLTTTIDGSYAEVSGTSASSAVASGIAALLLSKNPNLTPLEVRSIMESTTQPPQDRSLASNGSLDAFAALSYTGSAKLKMISPHTLDEFHIGDTIPIMGYAMSTLFTGYSLSWQKDYFKDSLGFDQFGNYGLIQYDSIVSFEFDTSSSQVIGGLLGTLNTHNFDTGTYTIILSVGSSDNRSTQERCNVYLNRSKPKFVKFTIDSIWVNAGRGLLLQATSDIPVQFDVRYSVPGAPPADIADDNIGFEHAILLDRTKAPAGVDISVHAELVTPNGDTTSVDTAGMIPNEAVPMFDPSIPSLAQGGFQEKPYSLPGGFALDSVLSVPAGDEVVENPNSSGIVTVYRFNSAKMSFTAVDSVPDPREPQWIGNSQGVGGPELIVEDPLLPNCNVYKQNGTHSILGSILFHDTLHFGSCFATVNPGTQNIVTVFDSAFQTFRYQKGAYSVQGTDTNVSPPDYYNQNNAISWGNVRPGDFLGTGTQELAVLDNDADLMIYERDSASSNGFRSAFSQFNNAASSGSLLAVGDFDGDGKPDIAYAYHPVEEQDTLDEYHAAYWTLVVLRNRGNFTFDTLYLDRFYGDNRDEHFFIGGPSGSLERITNVTGRSVNDLAVSFFPNFYLLEYDSASKTMRPVWNYPSSYYRAISWDFDRNGKRELGFFTGDSIRFFEHSDDYVERTPAPTGLTVTPRDTNRVDIEWAPVSGSNKYYILRASSNDVNYTLLDSTSSSNYVDSSVQNGDTLIYSVIGFDPSYSEPESEPALGMEAIVHPMPRLVGAAEASPQIIRVRTSQPPSVNKIFAGTIMVDDTVQPTGITSSRDSEIVLEIAAKLASGTHQMRVTSFGLRDYLNSPFDTAHYLAFEVPEDTIKDRFYIISWTFDEGPNGLRIHVLFNEEPGQNALDISHYSISPYGTLTSVARDTANVDALYIDVTGIQLTALGVPYVLCVYNITSTTNTPLDATNGNCAGISLTEPDLLSVFTYPDPAKESDGTLTFAGLTSSATVRIYSIRMKHIRDLTVQNSEGGILWDLRDDAGNAVPSGEYLYFVTGSNSSGQTVEGKAGKLVIVDDMK